MRTITADDQLIARVVSLPMHCVAMLSHYFCMHVAWAYSLLQSHCFGNPNMEQTAGAWVCAEGWVGTHQDSAKNWPDFDSSGGETHYYRAFTLACASQALHTL